MDLNYEAQGNIKHDSLFLAFVYKNNAKFERWSSY